LLPLPCPQGAAAAAGGTARCPNRTLLIAGRFPASAFSFPFLVRCRCPVLISRMLLTPLAAKRQRPPQIVLDIHPLPVVFPEPLDRDDYGPGMFVIQVAQLLDDFFHCGIYVLVFDYG